MRIVELSARDFRNLASVSLRTDAPLVVFCGANGQGKTNALEAVCALATLKGFRARRNEELIRFGQARAEVAGLVEDGASRRQFRLIVTPDRRIGEVDGKPPRELAEYFAGIRAVVFTPDDVRVVRGGPEERRRLLDRAAFTAGPSFLELARQYRRVLEQKSALLRSKVPDRLQIEVFNERLVTLGVRLVLRRRQIADELAGPFAELHGAIAGEGQATLRYRSRLGDGDEATLSVAYRELLARTLEEEIRRCQSLDGPQRDDLELRLDGRPARTYASQGQVRSIVLALRLSELVAAKKRGDRPIFLLDDLSSELDRLRTGRLVELVARLGVQCLLSTTEPALLSGRDDALFYRVDEGVIQAVDPPGAR